MRTAGVTSGCNSWGDEFCPGRDMNRAEAAAFLVRALGLPASEVDWFTDDNGITLEADINALAAAGITVGCTSTTFCPDGLLDRADLAALIARALELPFVEGDSFTDDDGTTHERDIERLAAAGITYGCSSTRFCPSATVSRDQMAAFLQRAFG